MEAHLHRQGEQRSSRCGRRATDASSLPGHDEEAKYLQPVYVVRQLSCWACEPPLGSIDPLLSLPLQFVYTLRIWLAVTRKGCPSRENEDEFDGKRLYVGRQHKHRSASSSDVVCQVHGTGKEKESKGTRRGGQEGKPPTLGTEEGLLQNWSYSSRNFGVSNTR